MKTMVISICNTAGVRCREVVRFSEGPLWEVRLYLQTSLLLQICDVSGASILHSLVPKSEVAVLEKCGHAISLERPRKCSSLLTHFISHITTPL